MGVGGKAMVCFFITFDGFMTLLQFVGVFTGDLHIAMQCLVLDDLGKTHCWGCCLPGICVKDVKRRGPLIGRKPEGCLRKKHVLGQHCDSISVAFPNYFVLPREVWTVVRGGKLSDWKSAH